MEGTLFANSLALMLGRIVMTLDCTYLLNKRHLNDAMKDGLALRRYPMTHTSTESHDVDTNRLTFDDIIVYDLINDSSHESQQQSLPQMKSIAIISYGNGVWTALEVLQDLIDNGHTSITTHANEGNESMPGVGFNVTIIDCPYLTSPPLQLIEFIQRKQFDGIVFADICKEGNFMPLGNFALQLHNRGALSNVSLLLITYLLSRLYLVRIRHA
jgi:hypothetical protein